jgi:acetyltransferase-like isoleucine patch superfamily enzyme
MHVSIGLYTNLINVNLENKTFVGSDCSIIDTKLGSHSYINSNTKILSADIGKYTSIGSNVMIGVGQHPTNLVTTHPAFYSNNKAFETYSDKMYYEEFDKCIIGNDVWIGSNSTILNGVKIGDGAIIALGAVVTKDVQPYSIVGGIPAKVLKFRFNENIIDRLLQIRWWEFEEDFLRTKYKLLHNPNEFIDYYENNIDQLESMRKL